MSFRKLPYWMMEHLTFGLRIHYLLKVFILQFATLFLTFQFTSPLSITIGNQFIFQMSYLFISALLLVVTGVFVKDMCLRTFNPQFHNWMYILLSAFLYILTSAIIVFLGFVTLIMASAQASGVDLFDIIAGIFFTTIFASLLAIGYHERLETIDHPTNSKIQESISSWQSCLSWVECDEGSHEKKKQRESFECACKNLADLFQHANTTQGDQLRSDFVNWWEKYSTHEPMGKEIIIMGQDKDKVKNEELHDEYKLFMDLKERIADISPPNDD